MSDTVRVIPLERLRMRDLQQVGGKNASLGEMIGELAAAGIRVPGGFATTADAFREFLQQDGLASRIERELDQLDVEDVGALARCRPRRSAAWIVEAALPAALLADIEHAYRGLVNGEESTAFAVRSSATAEDLPDASFAGQQDTFLNINGLDNILQAIPKVFASVYNDRAIAYRVHHGFAHADVALSAGIQRMVRSDKGAAGVHVHARHRVGIRRGGAHHFVVRTRRIGRAGRGEPGRVLRLQAEPRRGPSGDPAQERRQQDDADGARRQRQRRGNRRRSSMCRRRSACSFR